MMADTVTVAEAREELGIGKVAMARLIKESVIKTEPNPFDRRGKLITRQELERIKKAYPLKNAK